MNNLRPGDVVSVELWGHAENDELASCEVVGRLVELTDNAIRIRCWHDKTSDLPENNTTFTLALGACRDVQRYVRDNPPIYRKDDVSPAEAES